MSYPENNNSEQDSILPSLILAGMSPGMSPSAVSLVAFLNYSARRRSERLALREPGLLDQFRHFWSQYRKWREVRNKLGVSLDIQCTEVDEMLAEVQRHRWIEAEKAGRDIWASRNPHDPDTSALRDWFTKHFEKWRAARGQKIASA